jgi:predicted dinucleotide-binding enzyme
MRIGVLGTGDVGRVLAGGLAQLGHDVKLGSRNANRDRVTFAEATTFAELAILATLWSGTENAIRLAGPHNVAGKVVIDTTNPLDFSAGMPPKRQSCSFVRRQSARKRMEASRLKPSMPTHGF